MGEVKAFRVSSLPHPVVGGVAQAFHDLLVELQLLLVAEVEEGEEEDRQEESWEVESGDQGRVKERQTVYGVEMDVKCGQDSNLSQCECDEMCKEQDYVRTLSCAVLRKR